MELGNPMQNKKFKYRFTSCANPIIVNIERRYMAFPLNLLGWHYCTSVCVETAKSDLQIMMDRDLHKSKVVEL